MIYVIHVGDPSKGPIQSIPIEVQPGAGLEHSVPVVVERAGVHVLGLDFTDNKIHLGNWPDGEWQEVTTVDWNGDFDL